MGKSIRQTHEPRQVPTDAAEELEKETTVEPTESNHPKCKQREVVSYENRTTGGFFEKKTGHIYFKEDNLLHAISKLRYNICAVTCCCSYHKRSENSSGGRLQEVKNNAKSLNSRPQLVVAGAYRRDSNCKT